jgi:hypothetical protein
VIFDLVTPGMQAVAYILLLIVITTYYIKAFRQPELRRFWLLFAVAWTMNLIANIAWIIRFMVTQKPLDALSFIDIFYVIPYLLIGIALWRYPVILPRRTWLPVWIALFVSTSMVLALYFGYAVPNGRGIFSYFINFALYPILDAGLITLAWIRYRAAQDTRWTKIALFLACAVTSYGLGNTLELAGHVTAPVLGGFLQNFFWILRHVLLLMAAFVVHQPSDVEG